MRVANEKNAAVKTIQRPEASDWTLAVLEAMDTNTAIVAVKNCHWADDTLLDHVEIGEECRSIRVALVAEGIQSIGAIPSSIDRFQPDFLATASHYWLLCAYSF
jgi:selenocysteine lyase/cysteine desulfurase